jgi:hypothetical protein
MARNTGEKAFKQALLQELNEVWEAPDGTRQKRLRLVAMALINKAIGGDVMAIRELIDRVDGKPAQAVALGAGEEAGEPLQIVIKQMVDTSGKPLPPEERGTDRRASRH